MLLVTAVTANATVAAQNPPAAQAQPGCCPVVELRQYTLQPNSRDKFLALFEREFIETQEAVGNRVIGQFRDQDDANRFVWLRGFADMPARAQALQAFYGGPVWKAHRDEANAMIVDSDNVLLLHAVQPGSMFALEHARRAPLGTNAESKGLIVATIYSLAAPADAAFVDFFEHKLKPALAQSGTAVSAYFVSETSANNFPRLPVREGENAFVWFATYTDAQSYAKQRAALERSPQWRDEIATQLRGRLKAAPQILRLAPAPRSLLRE
jgi:quinol monooxygenase YgiN